MSGCQPLGKRRNEGAGQNNNSTQKIKMMSSLAKVDKFTAFGLTSAWACYILDLFQRSALLTQILVERGDRLLEDEREGLPLRLKFPHKVILNAREFDEPVGYSLLQISPDGDDCFEHCEGLNRRPIVIFDPRAGHGPGIGGFKRESEIGRALHRGHPVYFVAHDMQPCQGQTLAHVHHALRRFVIEVANRHPGERPALYGNCQAGWAVALLAADCSGVTGPTILNGAPLSYWGGDVGVNPMRLAGGLTGGVWIARMLADLSDGRFDGAWLAQNFENLNPGHAYFGKYKSLFAQPEAERERFIEFERWWGGFCELTRDEIVSIVENLFIENRFEEGGFRICESCYADLRRLKTPMLVFASEGDNITPPHQALGWISAVWPSTEALVASGQRIVYLINPNVGHLGIFVSAEVAKREHRAIIESLDLLESLPPGLYQMLIINSEIDDNCSEPELQIKFEHRSVEDLPKTDTTIAFERVRALSQQLDALYDNNLGPWVRWVGSPLSASILKWSHPMRISRIGWAHAFNPFAYGIDLVAELASALRVPTDADNPWIVAENISMDALSEVFDGWRRARDSYTEGIFSVLYKHP